MSVFARALDVQQETRAAPWAGRALFALTVLLLGLGLLWLYSASSFVATSEGLPSTYYLVQQATHAGVGLVALAAARFLDYRIWRRLAWPLLIVSIVLLVVVILPGTEAIAPRVNGARRWLRLGMTVQPSELAKSRWSYGSRPWPSRSRTGSTSLRYGLGPFLVVAGGICGLLLLEPHFSAALLAAVVTTVVLFAAGARLGHFALMAGFGLPLAWVVVTHAGYRSSRHLGLPPSDPGCAGSRLPAAAVDDRDRLGWCVRGRLRRQPSEAVLPARAPERLHLPDHRGGMGTGRAPSWSSGCSWPGRWSRCGSPPRLPTCSDACSPSASPPSSR